MRTNEGSFYSGKYRNVFQEYGYAETATEAKLVDAWNQLFFGAADTRIYYQTGVDESYILDTGNLDVRTEGMSYGMMFCVQMDRKAEFDRLWNWAKKYMWQSNGCYQGYFAWSVAPDGTKNSQGPAPDGEEYFALALFFAAHRWGDGPEPFNYSEQARAILRVCVHKGEDGIGQPLWNPQNKLIKFVPEMEISDPSYHLPHFYELFALWADPQDRQFWREAARASRVYLQTACHPLTGLAPEYAYYDGTPHFELGHGHFYSDSYRVAGNIALDFEWFRTDVWEREEANRLQAFFVELGLEGSNHKFKIDGEPFAEPALHPVGLLAMNAMASLAADGPERAPLVKAFWETPLRTGARRYYDNCLYFFSLLSLSGNYRIWGSKSSA